MVQSVLFGDEGDVVVQFVLLGTRDGLYFKDTLIRFYKVNVPSSQHAKTKQFVPSSQHVNNKPMTSKYLFQSQRLGFRNWITADIVPFTQMCQNEKVMEFFPSTLTEEKARSFVERMQQHFEENQFCYFAVERLDTQTFIGFIGLLTQKYESPFTPCVDMGWRLKKAAWGNGFATEGAKTCLQYAFKTWDFDKIYAMATHNNVNSIKVMKKIGMTQEGTFIHPRMDKDLDLQPCVAYSITQETFNQRTNATT